ncbi:MAG: AAA family ATPase [Lewinellaceae bacterium]|nr:AAA family ATPase [Saprospiraceae bacterium]MCB9338709.1 AAA family ATPase [Lewinellaceae bacterium]
MKPFRITGLEAHQIGPFGDLKMAFPEKPKGMEDKAEIHILTGENGVGKSTVLEILTFGFGGDIQLVEKKFRNNTKGAIETYFSEGSSAILKPQYIPSTIRNPFKFITISKSAVFTFGAFAYSGYRKVEHVLIHSIQELENSPFENAVSFRESINPALMLQWIANNIAKEAIAKNQNDEVSAYRFRSAISQLEQTITKIIDQPLRFIFDYNPMGISIEVNHERLDFNLLPDGLKSIVSWLADLLMRMDRVKWVDDIPVFERNFILFLDEIEVHMHPKWQRKILPAVQGLFPNAQIFISTHSPFVVGSVDGAWIHKLVKPNGDSVAEEPILSEDGKSVQLILEEIFDLGELDMFGENVKNDLQKFYGLINDVMKGSNGETTESLLQLARTLAVQSTELHTVIEMEIRQLNRKKNMQLAL